MKSKKLKLAKLEVKSFTTSLDETKLKTIGGGAKGSSGTTPDPTPLTTTDEPIDIPASGAWCDTKGVLCPKYPF